MRERLIAVVFVIALVFASAPDDLSNKSIGGIGGDPSGLSVPGELPSDAPSTRGEISENALKQRILRAALIIRTVDDRIERAELSATMNGIIDLLILNKIDEARELLTEMEGRAEVVLREQRRQWSEADIRELEMIAVSLEDGTQKTTLENALAVARDLKNEGIDAETIRERIGNDAAALLAERQSKKAAALLEQVRIDIVRMREGDTTLHSMAVRQGKMIGQAERKLEDGMPDNALHLLERVSAEQQDALRATPLVGEVVGMEEFPVLSTQGRAPGTVLPEEWNDTIPAAGPERTSASNRQPRAVIEQMKGEVREQIAVLKARLITAHDKERSIEQRLTMATPEKRQILRRRLAIMRVRKRSIPAFVISGSLDKVEALVEEVERDLASLEEQLPRISALKSEVRRIRPKKTLRQDRDRVRTLISNIRLRELDDRVENMPVDYTGDDDREVELLLALNPTNDEIANELAISDGLEAKVDIELSGQVVALEGADDIGPVEKSVFTMSVSATEAVVDVRIVKIIPKVIAVNVADLAFSAEPDVVESDPIVLWDLGHLEAGEEVELVFTADGAVEPTSVGESEVLVLKSPAYAAPHLEAPVEVEASEELIEQIAETVAVVTEEPPSVRTTDRIDPSLSMGIPLQDEPGFFILIMVLVLVAAFLVGVVFKADMVFAAPRPPTPPASGTVWDAQLVKSAEWNIPPRSVKGYQSDPLYPGRYREQKKD
ncbi:MAG: hypothetical protein QF415_03325 [Candidatus Undinarchaeales archaeon]|jgi:hypothetical protein|nr:hypothetical protein [Candidatus Undinarchaeales archaeon]MDP7491746.1 hypothetical protein [Candidatus Undinarchaeales archaeon]